MNTRICLFCFLVSLTFFAGCEIAPPEITVEPIGGREPEVITWVSGQQWFPATIAILVEEDSEGHIYLEASSSANKGYKRTLRLNIIDNEQEWLPLDTINLLQTDFPTRVTVEYEQFRDSNNHNSSLWLGDKNDLGGLKITKLESEEGVLYAAGEFFMKPYIFNSRPDIQEIEGLFNNIRVFENEEEMRQYFAHITALEAAGN